MNVKRSNSADSIHNLGPLTKEDNGGEIHFITESIKKRPYLADTKIATERNKENETSIRLQLFRSLSAIHFRNSSCFLLL